jgi:hypothetical protein
MKLLKLTAVLLLAALPVAAQAPEGKYVADTIVVQAEGRHEADPDLATLAFHVSAQEKELRKAYERATESLNRIVRLAERNGLRKADISTGAFTAVPVHDWRDRNRKTRAFRVEGGVTLRVRDFSRVGALIDESVEEGIVDFRSLTFSIEDEEAAKQRAIAEATRRAEARARAALSDSGRKLGALRYMSVDVQQPVGIVQLEAGTIGALAEARATAMTAAPPPPPVAPEKIRITATVSCVFQLQ